MPVRSLGASAISSAAVSENSNSKPIMSNENPAANPRTGRLDGVALVPTKAVRSASAGAAAHRIMAAIDRVRRTVRHEASLVALAGCWKEGSAGLRASDFGLRALA